MTETASLLDTISAANRPINSSTRGHLLLVDDDADLLTLLEMRLRAGGFQISTASSGNAALSQIAASRPDLVVTDVRMDGMDGMQLFAEIARRHSGLPVILLTAHGTIPDAVAATQRGAFGYLTKPYDAQTLIAQINRALDVHGVTGGKPETDEGASWRAEIISKSPLMEALLTRTERLAKGDGSVLIQGESGTGKELLARALHNASPRAAMPFIALNCGAMPENLLESELFGHKKGSFTGAVADHPGLFLEADGGTLFLDEIGDMPLPLQVKLLRVLEAREVRALGSTKTVPINVRVISASHRDLSAAKDNGHFREDLYYRLNVLSLVLPPLRERREDIPLLVAHLTKRIATRYQKNVPAFSTDALASMAGASWPGNIRQLQNVIEQAIALATTDIIPLSVVEQALQVGETELRGFEETRLRFEFDYLTKLLSFTHGSVTQAAKIAKRNRTEFYKLLQRHGIEAAHFKDAQ